VVACSGNGVSTVNTVGVTDGGRPADEMRVYAGLRADPAFGDVAKLQATVSSGQLAFVDAGTGANAFAAKNVLAIVVEIDVDKVLFPQKPPADPRPLIAVSAETVRLP
jgi:hypothetical protein